MKYSFSNLAGLSMAVLLSAQLVCAVPAAGDADRTAPTQRDHPPKALDNLDATNTIYAFSRDGAHFVSAGPDGKIKYGRTIDGAVLRTFYLCAPTALAFSPDGILLAAAGRSCHEPIISVWQVTDGKTLHRLANDMGELWSLTFTTDGHFLIGHAEKPGAKVWPLSNLEPH